MSKLGKVNKRLDDAIKDRDKARKAFHDKSDDIEAIRRDLNAERKARDELLKNKSQIKAQLEKEAKLDKQGEGEKTEDWEQRKRDRLDSLADEVDECIAQIDRLLEHIDDKQDRRKALAKEIAGDQKRIGQLRDRKKDIIKAQQAKGDLTAHFSMAEFDCHNGQKVPSGSKPALMDWCQKVGEPLHARFGSVHVNSGFRPAAYNASIGGEPNSVHIYDYPGRSYRAAAVDITCERGSPSEWFAFTAGRADGRGKYATFHHADNRNRIGWADAVWYG
jgi:Peptidase M15